MPPELLHSSALRLLLCRYVDGKLKREMMLLADTKYIAISHVWGEASWQRIDGLNDDILVSNEKAKFMSEQLQQVVGSEYFWMDILCIDQRDKGARVAVTQFIPAIFRRAQKTVVIREGIGFRDCCLQAAHLLNGSTTTEWTHHRILPLLLNHYKKHHSGEDFVDGITSRLWPLQEILLSNTIQFVRCDLRQNGRYDPSVLLPGWHIQGLVMQIAQMNLAWRMYGCNWSQMINNITNDPKTDLVYAFLTCGIVTRTPITEAAFRPYDFQIETYKTHTRRSSRPQDFILAIMPQYRFYTLPPNAKELSFGQLYVDCLKQLQAKNNQHSLTPFFFGNHPASLNPMLPENVPEPLFLSDLAKLFVGPGIAILRKSLHTQGVSVERISDIPIAEVTKTIRQAYQDDDRLFQQAGDGELMEMLKYRSLQNDQSSEIPNSLSTKIPDRLTLIFISRYLGGQFDATSLPSNSPLYFITLAALINCGIGMSAYEWSKGRLSPVFVKHKDRRFLALVPDSVFEWNIEPKFFITETERGLSWKGRRFMLLAADLRDETKVTYCFAPPCVNLLERKKWKKWTFWK
jgi:hypothetical protein